MHKQFLGKDFSKASQSLDKLTPDRVRLYIVYMYMSIYIAILMLYSYIILCICDIRAYFQAYYHYMCLLVSCTYLPHTFRQSTNPGSPSFPHLTPHYLPQYNT